MSRSSLGWLGTPSLRLQRQSKSAPTTPVPTRRKRSNTAGFSRSRTRRGTRLPAPKYKKRVKSDYTKKADKKVGPRQLGRNKYKGSKYKDKNHGNWLEDRVHQHSRSSSFMERKKKNPVKKNKTVQEVGTPNSWKKPGYYHDEVIKMNSGGHDDWLQEKPMSVRDNKLDSLKDEKVPKGKNVKQYGSPNAWRAIEFKYENVGGGFLDEKLWFEGSAVHFESGLARIIEALPPKKKMELNKLPSPTGYQSKIEFIKKLRDIVMGEVKNMHREQLLLERLQQKQHDLQFIAESGDDFTDLDEFVDEIGKDLEKQLDDAMD
eukprot:282803_1